MKLSKMLPAVAKRQSPQLLLAALAGWVLLLASDRQLILPGLCLSAHLPPASGGVETILAFNPVPTLILGWLAMMLAMMPPLLRQPLTHLWHRSLARRRIRAIVEFATGYGAVWLAAGIVLMAVAILLEAATAATGIPAFVAAAALVILWQITPARQICLNRCHRLPRLSAFGAEADRDCIHFGLTHGLWCAATCSPLMLLPLATPAFHLPLMFAISAGLLLERMMPARHPSWTFRILPGQIVIAMLLRSTRWSGGRIAGGAAQSAAR